MFFSLCPIHKLRYNALISRPNLQKLVLVGLLPRLSRAGVSGCHPLGPRCQPPVPAWPPLSGICPGTSLLPLGSVWALCNGAISLRAPGPLQLLGVGAFEPLRITGRGPGGSGKHARGGQLRFSPWCWFPLALALVF